MNRRTLIIISFLMTLIFGLVGCNTSNLSDVASTDGTFSAKAITSVSFSPNPGALNMYKYAPASMPANAPLVVAMHGCTQSANDYASLSGWNTLADRWKFYVVYVEQTSSNNQNKCFNFFEPGDQVRGSGEAASIKAMVDTMKAAYSIDNSRVYVTGLSAGGYMTPVILAAYPDVFAGGAIMAGGPYKCASSMTDAFTCMSPGVDKTPAQWGDLARSGYSGYTGPYPVVSIWHGSSDYTVKDTNAVELVDQWTNVHGADQTADVDETFKGYPHKVYKNASGKAVVEYYNITGMGHGITVDPGTGEDQGGATGAYSLDNDIWSSYYAGKFWGLDNSDKTAPVVSITSPSNGASVSGTVTVAATATDDVSMSKVEFYVNGALKATDTSSPYSYSWNTSSLYTGSYTVVAKAYDVAGNTADSTVSVSVQGATDTVAPTASVTAPAASSELHGTVAFTANASDAGIGVAKVEFYVDGSKVGEDTTSPYAIDLDTTLLSSAAHSLTVKATDGAGNAATSSAVSVTVNQVLICHTEEISATATSHYTAGRLDVTGYTTYGAEYGYNTAFTLYHLDTANGGAWVDVHDVPAGCYTEGGVVVDPDPVPVTDTTAPVVNVTAPTADVAAGSITITASASDNVGVTKVEFYANGTLIATDTSAPYSVSYTAVAGSLAIKAIAYDAAGNTATDNDTTVTVTSGGSTAACFTANNMTHNTAGRTNRISSTDYRAKGSNDALGWGVTTTSLMETSPGYFVKVTTCP